MNIYIKNTYLIVALFVISMTFGLSEPTSAFASSQTPINLLSTSNFVILSQTGITNTGTHTSLITGNIGSSPITGAAMDNIFCSEIVGTIYSVDAGYTGSGVQTCLAGNPPLSNKTLVDNAILDLGIVYAEASGRPSPDSTELYAGNLGGQNFLGGLYKWSTDVTIPSDVTLTGGSNDVWIFQIAGDLSVASSGSVPTGVKVILAGGALEANVFWQVGGATGATLGTYSTFKGNIISNKQIIIQTGAILIGRALAQTQVTLDANQISVPPPAPPYTPPPATPVTPAETPTAPVTGYGQGFGGGGQYVTVTTPNNIATENTSPTYSTTTTSTNIPAFIASSSLSVVANPTASNNPISNQVTDPTIDTPYFPNAGFPPNNQSSTYIPLSPNFPPITWNILMKFLSSLIQ